MIALPTVTTPPARAGPKDTMPYLSFSALSLFMQCPLRFQFRYIDGLSEQSVSASLVFGSAIHQAIQHHYERLLISSSPPSLDGLLDAFQEAWRQENREIRFGRGEDINSIGRLADHVLRAFQQSAIARPSGVIVGIEEELRGELLPGVPDLLGRVDLLVETPEAWLVTDFKTARSAWSEGRILDAALQLLLYHELVQPLADGKPIRVAFAVLTKAKVPEVVVHPVSVNERRLKRARAIVEQVWLAIQAGHFYPSPSAANCISCPYRGPCRDWTG